MTKDDRLVPVVNLVVYYGEEEWDASKELHEMLDFGESKFEMIQYKQDKNGLVNYIENHREQLNQIDEEALDMFGVFLHKEERFDRYRKNDEGRTTMRNAIDELFDELIDKGRAQAEQEAEEKVKKAQEETQKMRAEFLQAAKELKEFLPCEVIAEKMNLPLEMVSSL